MNDLIERLRKKASEYSWHICSDLLIEAADQLEFCTQTEDTQAEIIDRFQDRIDRKNTVINVLTIALVVVCGLLFVIVYK